MRYTKSTDDPHGDFLSAREAVEAEGGEVLSGESAEGFLAITTAAPIAPALCAALGLTGEG